MKNLSKLPRISRSEYAQSSFEIVPAVRSDMELVADFVRSSAHWYKPIVNEKDMGEHAVDKKWAEINFKRRDFYIGYANDEAIGTISMQYFGEYAYLGYIYLDIEHVGKGFGQRLIGFAESVARGKNMSAMVLIGHPHASWAKRAYLKYGFHVVASDKDAVLAWEGGVLEPYYEEDFELYLYDLKRSEEAQSLKLKEVAHG